MANHRAPSLLAAFHAGFWNQTPQANQGNPRSEVDPLEQTVWQLTDEDQLTMRDCLNHCICFGSSGSGKSSSVMATMMRRYMASFSGGLILTCNPGDLAEIQGAAADAGRSDQLVVISPESEFVLNPLHSEVLSRQRGGGTVPKLIDLLMTGQELFSQEEKSHGGADPFWQQQHRVYLQQLLRLDMLAQGGISLKNLLGYLRDAPRSMEEVNDAKWQETSLVERAIAKAFERCPGKRKELQAVGNFFLREFPRMADKTRESVVSGLVGLLAPLVDEPLHRYFCQPSNVHPQDTWQNNMILCIDYPVSQYGMAGRLLQGMILYAYMKAVEGRDLREEPGHVFIIADEMQVFWSSYCTQFQAYARGKGCATLFATQSRAAFADRQGGGPSAGDTLDAFLANFGTVFCLAVDQATAKWFADSVGEKWGMISNVGGGHGQQGGQLFAGATEHKKHQIEPQELTSLKRGGPPHNYAECIAYRHGKTWSDGKSFLRLKVPQVRRR